MYLLLSTLRRDPQCVVRVIGEVDLDTAKQLYASLLTTSNGDGRQLVVDMAGVQFMDATGLRVLLAVRDRQIEVGGSLTLAYPPRCVLRLLEVTGLSDAFPVLGGHRDLPSITSPPANPSRSSYPVALDG